MMDFDGGRRQTVVKATSQDSDSDDQRSSTPASVSFSFLQHGVGAHTNKPNPFGAVQCLPGWYPLHAHDSAPTAAFLFKELAGITALLKAFRL